MSSIRHIKEQKRAIIRGHAQSNNVKGLKQVLTSLASLALLWWVAVLSVEVSPWLTVPAVLLISLFTLRAFALMHECGHGSLFSHSAAQSRIRFSAGCGLGHAAVRVVAAS